MMFEMESDTLRGTVTGMRKRASGRVQRKIATDATHMQNAKKLSRWEQINSSYSTVIQDTKNGRRQMMKLLWTHWTDHFVHEFDLILCTSSLKDLARLNNVAIFAEQLETLTPFKRAPVLL